MSNGTNLILAHIWIVGSLLAPVGGYSAGMGIMAMLLFALHLAERYFDWRMKQGKERDSGKP